MKPAMMERLEGMEDTTGRSETPKPKDEIWDALTEEFGEVRTASERGRRNRAVKELRQAKVTPDEIHTAVRYCRRNFTHFTEMAVCNWLSHALKEADEVSRETKMSKRDFERALQDELEIRRREQEKYD